MKVTFDVETTIQNKGHPFDPRNFLVSYAYKVAGGISTFRYFHDPDFITDLRNHVEHATELVGFNIKFDLHWCQRVGIRIPIDCRIWDCSLAEFIISGQTARFISLNESLTSYGEARKPDLVAEYWAQNISTEHIPLPILEEYNLYDVDGTSTLQEHQQQLMSPEQINLCYLMGEDLKTLQHAEYAGIKWDEEKAREAVSSLTTRITSLETELQSYLPTLRAEIKFNWDSGDQLSAFLYGGEITYDWAVSEDTTYKSGERKGQAYVKNTWHSTQCSFPRRFKPLEGTEIKKTLENAPNEPHFYQTDDPTLKQLQTKTREQREVLGLLHERAALTKVLEMIESIQKKSSEMNWEDNMIHGQFNQNVVVTGRLSSSGPNLQNTPLEIDELLVSRYD